MKKRIFKILALLIGLGIGGLLLVGFDFVVFWYDHYTNDVVQKVRDANERGPGIYEKVPQGGVRLKRWMDQSFHSVISERDVRIQTNNLGYRSPYIGPKQPGEVRILVLGDSITEASYCEYNETYPYFIEELTGVRTINGGIGASSLHDSFNVLNETGLLTQPDIVVVGMYLNDVSSSHLYTPLNKFLGKSAAFQKLYQAYRYGQIETETKERYKELTGEDLPEPAPEGAWRTDPQAFEYEKSVAPWGTAWYQETWDQLEKDMQAFADAGRQDDFELVILLFPCTHQVEAEFLDDTPQQFWKEIVERMNVPHLDLLPVLRDAYQKNGKSLAYDHCHLTPQGNRLVAERISTLLMPLLDGADERVSP